MTRTAAFTSEMMFAPSGTSFRGSDLQRQYRNVLDAAKHSPVQITDSDGHQLAIAVWDEVKFAWTFLRMTDAIAQFHAAWAVHREESPAQWVGMTPFPFLSVFDAEDVEEFSNELVTYLEESVRRRDLTGFLGNLRAWESSAETYNDEAMLAQMNEASGPSEHVAVSVADPA